MLYCWELVSVHWGHEDVPASPDNACSLCEVALASCNLSSMQVSNAFWVFLQYSYFWLLRSRQVQCSVKGSLQLPLIFLKNSKAHLVTSFPSWRHFRGSFKFILHSMKASFLPDNNYRSDEWLPSTLLRSRSLPPHPTPLQSLQLPFCSCNVNAMGYGNRSLREYHVIKLNQ